MKSALRAWRIGRVVLHYRLDDLLDDTPAQRWLRLGKPFVPRAPAQVAALPRGARLRLALQELGPIFVKFGQILSTRRDLIPADIAAELTLLQDRVAPFDGEMARNIVELAQNTPELSILVEAVVAAGLAPTLSTGTLTVFAPTNAAFAALLTELGVTKEALLANKPLLTAVLTYHVLGSKVMRADVPLGKAITPVSGGFFKIESNNGLKITDGRNRVSTITSTDIQASNGVVHLVDKVLLPADKDIVATASALPDFSILVEAVVAAGLVSTLQGAGPFTVFAPTNAAFAALLTELGVTKDALLANKTLLTQVLTYHVVPARVLKAEVPVNTAITTVQGQTFTINSSLVITDQNMRTSNIVTADVFTSNGVIHVVDKVILPK